MKVQRNVSGGMREIKAYDTSFTMSRLCNARHVKNLACRIVDRAQKNKSHRLALALDNFLYVLIANAGFAVASREFKQRKRRIEAMKSDLRFDGVLIRRERAPFDEDLMPLFCRT